MFLTMESCSPQRLLFNLVRLPWRQGGWNKNNSIPVPPYCGEYVRLSAPHVQHRRRRLRRGVVWHCRYGQHMASRRHGLIVTASLHNVVSGSPIDLKIESQIPSKVRGPQNNKASTRLSDGRFGGRARLCWTPASCRRRYFRCSGSGQWRDLFDFIFARLYGVLCKISSGSIRRSADLKR
jgi:hypothetical protein